MGHTTIIPIQTRSSFDYLHCIFVLKTLGSHRLKIAEEISELYRDESQCVYSLRYTLQQDYQSVLKNQISRKQSSNNLLQYKHVVLLI